MPLQKSRQSVVQLSPNSLSSHTSPSVLYGILLSANPSSSSVFSIWTSPFISIAKHRFMVHPPVLLSSLRNQDTSD